MNGKVHKILNQTESYRAPPINTYGTLENERHTAPPLALRVLKTVLNPLLIVQFSLLMQRRKYNQPLRCNDESRCSSSFLSSLGIHIPDVATFDGYYQRACLTSGLDPTQSKWTNAAGRLDSVSRNNFIQVS